MKDLFNGRPDFPKNEPKRIPAGSSSTDTDEVYCIDTLGVEATFGAGMIDLNTEAASEWAGNTFTGVMYGRWSNVAADVTLACYTVDTANSEG